MDAVLTHFISLHRDLLIPRTFSSMDQSQLNWLTNFIWGIADDVLRDVEVDGALARHPVDHAADLAHHLRADAVTGEDEEFLVGGHFFLIPVRR